MDHTREYAIYIVKQRVKYDDSQIINVAFLAGQHETGTKREDSLTLMLAEQSDGCENISIFRARGVTRALRGIFLFALSKNDTVMYE